MTANYSIGIDLGTTNTVVAYTPLSGESEVRRLLIPQLTARSQSEYLPSLPSFVYLSTVDEDSEALSIASVLEGGAYNPADNVAAERFVVGEFARRAAAENPDRVVAAAKSWLSHAGVDRQAAILPWTDDPDVLRISPLQASRLILEHIVAAWNAAFPDDPLQSQKVVLTVPASFDMAARELTLQAAFEAGLPHDLVPLEEPQAAVYNWIDRTGDRWRRQLAAGDQILVVDVGGGTTDLAVVRVEEEAGELQLSRVAVGDHLLVGGDNMDLALAHHASEAFARDGHKLNPWQSISLWHAARTAKETLLSGGKREEYSLTVLGRGSRLIGSSVSTSLTAAEVERVLVDGFFPLCRLGDRPDRGYSSGFQEIGLPFEQDTAITRHVAAFVADHCGDPASGSNGTGRPPNKLLFNGGVFKSAALRSRMLEVYAGFDADTQVAVLGEGEDLDAAVACGAAYYGRSKYCGGLRIRGGTSRSYYVGIETAGLAVPGRPRPLSALCVVPKGMEEGTETDVPSRDIGLLTNREVSFRFFAANNRGDDRPGLILKRWDEDELVETSPMTTSLDAGGGDAAHVVPVRFFARITELGTLELWCISQQSDSRWKLELDVRGDDLN